MAINKSRLGTWMLLLGVAFWAATFVVIKEALAFVDVYSFISVRFLIAAILLFIIFHKRFKKSNSELYKKGFLIGLVLAGATVCQTIGLKYTSASNAAFITGLSVVMVPAFVSVLDKKLPKISQVFAVLMALIGLALLTFNSGFTMNVGDLWILSCAAFYAIHLIMVSRMIKKIDPPSFTTIQLFTVGIVVGIIGLFFNGKIKFSNEFIAWRAILFCAIFASAYMYTTQAYLQRFITEIKVAIIFSFEPLFTAIIAYLYLAEILTLKAIIGGFLIFFAMIVSELKIKSKEKFPEAT